LEIRARGECALLRFLNSSCASSFRFKRRRQLCHSGAALRAEPGIQFSLQAMDSGFAPSERPGMTKLNDQYKAARKGWDKVGDKSESGAKSARYMVNEKA